MSTLCDGGDGLCTNEAEADGKCDGHHAIVLTHTGAFARAEVMRHLIAGSIDEDEAERMLRACDRQPKPRRSK